jgi:hypothetical protein
MATTIVVSSKLLAFKLGIKTAFTPLWNEEKNEEERENPRNKNPLALRFYQKGIGIKSGIIYCNIYYCLQSRLA